MAWEDQDQAFVVYDAKGVRISTDAGSLPAPHPPTFDVGVGSTGSVGQVPAVASSSVFGTLSHPAFGALRPLRTFVVPDPKLVGVNLADPVSSNPADGFAAHGDYPVAAPNPDVICYFETRADAASLDLDPSGGRLPSALPSSPGVVRHHRVHPPASKPSVRSYPLLPTGVLRQLRAIDPTTSTVAETVGVADFTSGTFSATTQALAFGMVTLQDPHVTQVPPGNGGALDGRWLMVLTRQRVIAGMSPGPSGSLCDIVLYVSDDATFTAPVGPFLVVDALNALERFGTGDWSFRVWCSVPSAVVDRDDLLVCFMAEASAVDAASLGDSGANAAGYTGGPAMVRIALADLEIAAASGPVAESTWESTYDSTGRCGAAVPSTPLGPVRIWVVDPDDAVTPYQPLLSRFPGAKAADPAVVVAGEQGVLTLYFAVLRDDSAGAGLAWAAGTGTTNGQGIWRGSDFSAVHLRTPSLGRFAGTRGLDFLIRCGRTSPFTRADAPDLVRPSNDADGFFADPDPFPLPDGSWIVFAGRASKTVSPHPTSATAGTVEDAVVDYAADFAPRRAAPFPQHPLYWNP